ncbi:hypothetical protein WICPIJ_001384 [Wickerhamomyces pijperi]|uniref:Uncharacterized protein n=1 Tax=Wickerhamomyces pijperi TaxID=599730 RepID=A0A9P8TQN1_WICPI|nr:hypothetical protein WICPIJ_001384 [Wickerhamomyces pijperi]
MLSKLFRYAYDLTLHFITYPYYLITITIQSIRVSNKQASSRRSRELALRLIVPVLLISELGSPGTSMPIASPCNPGVLPNDWLVIVCISLRLVLILEPAVLSLSNWLEFCKELAADSSSSSSTSEANNLGLILPCFKSIFVTLTPPPPLPAPGVELPYPTTE